GQEAVAQVVLNRVKSQHFPDTVCAVVYQGARERQCQFSFACDGASASRREPRAWRRARSVAERALAGHVMTKVGDATSFHLASLGHIWGRRMVRVAQVGRHVFFDPRGHRARAAEAPAASVIASANGPTRS
ncbi:MAG: cell wall hydrolase, partial [Caulobacteraceae bacterium]